jgi:hypothetical protein
MIAGNRLFRKFAASRPKAMKNPLFPVIASVAHVPPATSKAWWSVAWGKQSPGRQGDCFGGYRRLAMTGPRGEQGVPFVLKFPEVKMHYRYFRIWIRLL